MEKKELKTEKKLLVNCPQCKTQFNYYDSEFRPFCSERCKMIDLGHWFDESYSVSGRDNSVYIEDPQAFEKLGEDGDG